MRTPLISALLLAGASLASAQDSIPPAPPTPAANDSIRITATCVRVPVRIGHGESVNLEFANPISPDEARSILRKAPGVIVLDGDDGVPLQQLAAGRDETFVGRIRRDPTVEHGLNLWVVADNLRKGAATNAVQIAERLLPMLGR